jgi:spermidine/putrescine-binding protein
MAEEPPILNILAPHSRRAALEREFTRRKALTAALGGAASLYLAGCGGTSGGGGAQQAAPIAKDAKVEAGPMLMANWPDYTDPKTYKDYTAAVGPDVKVEGFGSNSELVAKLSAGGSEYDIVVPSGSYVPQLAQKGLARELDHSLIPNLKNLQPKFTKNVHDPGNKYSVTKDYGITTFYYRKDVVPNPPDTLLGWFQLLPKLKGKNVNFIEGAAETLPLPLLALGLSPTTTNAADYEKAMQLMMAAKPAIKTINSTYIERLSRGQIDVGLGWNGDIARGAAEAKKKGVDIGMFVPQDRGWTWTDDWVIAAGGKNPVAAHKWINYMLDPKVAGQEWNYVVYPIPVIGADQYADPKVAKNTMTNIPQDVIATYSMGKLTPELTDMQAKYYGQFRAA